MDLSSKSSYLTEHPSSFQPYQVVCLENGATCLYAEVVQVVEARQVCWVRPLMLVNVSEQDQTDNSSTPQDWYDLRNGSDLLCPLALFRSALDTEALPLLACLHASSPTASQQIDRVGHQQFNQFIYQVWQAHPEMF